METLSVAGIILHRTPRPDDQAENGEKTFREARSFDAHINAMKIPLPFYFFFLLRKIFTREKEETLSI